jgi:hypothetical protein
MILAMPPRRSVDLAVPAQERQIEELPANVWDFASVPRLPPIFGPLSVFAMAEQQRKRATEKTVVRHERRKRRRR